MTRKCFHAAVLRQAGYNVATVQEIALETNANMLCVDIDGQPWKALVEKRSKPQSYSRSHDNTAHITTKHISKAAPRQSNLDCIHRGEIIGEAQCPSCSGNVRVKVFACSLHQSCTISRKTHLHRVCDRCPDLTQTPPNNTPSSKTSR